MIFVFVVDMWTQFVDFILLYSIQFVIKESLMCIYHIWDLV